MQQATEWLDDVLDDKVDTDATDSKVGSAGRVDVYAARYEAGLPIWNEADAVDVVTIEEKAADLQHEASRRLAAEARTALTRWAHTWLVAAAVETGVDLDTAPPDDRYKLAGWIRRRREKLGLERTELAKLMGISVKDINRYETGLYLPEVKTVERLSRALSSGSRGDE